MSERRLRVFIRSCYEQLRSWFGSLAESQSSRPAPIAGTADMGHDEFGEALTYLQQGQLDAAESIYRTLLNRQPDNADALHFLGVLQAQRRNLAEAAELIGRALALDPGNAAAHSNCGNVFRMLARNEDALASYDRALALDPESVEVRINRGDVLLDLGRQEAALASYDSVLAIKPDSAKVLNDRGVALGHLRRRTEALDSFDRAVACSPGFAEAHNNRGALLAEMGQHDEALASYDRALTIRPDAAGFLNNRGDLLRVMGLYELAAQDYSRLLELKPEYDQALGHKLYVDMQICSWKHYNADRQRLLRQVRDGKSILPFTVLVLSDSGAEQLQSARTYVSQKYAMAAKPLWTGERYRHDRIRIAYLSADFYWHATTHLMVELFERHDKERFEVSAWSFGPDVRDNMRDRLQKAFEQFIDVRGKSDDEVATMLRDQEIDIAVDLKGYSKGCRPAVFAQRAVPIQINYLVYPGTTGADYMDYIIGDIDVIPEGDEDFYTEKVVRLPDSYQVNGSKRVNAEKIPGRAEVKLPESGFVFCCFNNNYKITPDVFDIWMRLLDRVEGSVLWLLEGNAAASRNLRLEAKARGVGAERLIFAPRMSPSNHLARHRLADLFLDTLPCNAHTTASDALWAGLPVLTCRGAAFPGRVAASLLRTIGLPDLIAESLDDYEALAFKLATTPDLMADIRLRLERNRMTYPLFDTDRFRRHIESAYVTMYERYQRGEPPHSFAVPEIA